MLPGGLRALGGVLFASSLPSYILMLGDQMKTKEKETYRRALTRQLWKGGGAAWLGRLGGCVREGHEGQPFPTTSSPRVCSSSASDGLTGGLTVGSSRITPFLKQ